MSFELKKGAKSGEAKERSITEERATPPCSSSQLLLGVQ